MKESKTHSEPGMAGRTRGPIAGPLDVPGEGAVEVRMTRTVGDRREKTVCKLDRSLAHHYVEVLNAAEYVNPKDADPPVVNDRSMKKPPRGK